VFLDGYHGDTSKMVHVGKVSDKARKLCEVSRAAAGGGGRQRAGQQAPSAAHTHPCGPPARPACR
jgi:hypothetical protein